MPCVLAFEFLVGWRGPLDARETIRRARERYLQAHAKPAGEGTPASQRGA